MAAPDLSGRLVVVTGAGRGLGLSIARDVVASGGRVAIVDRDGERLASAFAALGGGGSAVMSIEADISDESSVDAMADLISDLGPVWGLVNNAALADGVGGLPFDEISVANWDRLMNVNVRGTWLVSRALLRCIRSGGGGRIVNLASDTALRGWPNLAHYITSKGAIIALTRAMARELGDEGITVNAVAPGIVDTESTQGIPEHRHRDYAQGRAISRVQTPEDVVGAVTFLLGDAARYITGHTLVVDGGLVMH